MRVASPLLLLALCLHETFASHCKSPCTAPDGEPGLCFEEKCLSHVEEEVEHNLTFTITVKYPESELQKHGGAALYIRGNGLGLLWMKGKQLSKSEHDTWNINIVYKSAPDGFQCQSCTDQNFLPDNKLQYRIFVDDRTDMLGANSAIQFPISETSSYFEVMPDFLSFPWFYQKTGSLQSFVIQSKHIGRNRNVTIYTPPSFNENVYKVYPTIIAFDLTMELATFLQRNYEGPILPNAVSEEYIIIGFGDYRNNGAERMDLLTPTAGPSLQCKNGTFENNCDNCIPVDSSENATEYMWYFRNICGNMTTQGGQGDNTLDFLTKEALPYAKQQVNARLQTDNLGVIGYSLGGLMSCYAAWTRPHVFSAAACQSSSFWWPYNNQSINKVEFDFLNKTMKDPAYQTNRPHQRIYIDVGGAEDVDPYRLTQSTIELGDMFDKLENYKLDENVWVTVDPKKIHHYVEWGKRMRQALVRLYPAKGAPKMPAAQASLIG